MWLAIGSWASFMWPLKISKVLFPRNGVEPVKTSYSRQPREYKSDLPSIASEPCICSGDMYKGVPTVVFSLVIESSVSAEAMPKSVSFTSPASFRSTLAGLISR